MRKNCFWQKSVWGSLLIIGMVLLFGNCDAHAKESIPDTNGLSELVAQWVELRHQISLEKNTWDADRALLVNEKQLLEKEKKMLQEEMISLTRNSYSQSATQARLLAEKKESENVLQSLLSPMLTAEESLLLWEKRLPPSLAEPLKNYFEKIASATEKTVSRRLQTILTLYAQIEIYQNTIQIGKEVLTVGDGKEMEMDVLYIGLVRGFCLSHDGRFAGVATPSKTGWTWQWRAELAPAIQLAFDYYMHKKIADYISLPMSVTGGGQ